MRRAAIAAAVWVCVAVGAFAGSTMHLWTDQNGVPLSSGGLCLGESVVEMLYESGVIFWEFEDTNSPSAGKTPNSTQYTNLWGDYNRGTANEPTWREGLYGNNYFQFADGDHVSKDLSSETNTLSAMTTGFVDLWVKWADIQQCYVVTAGRGAGEDQIHFLYGMQVLSPYDHHIAIENSGNVTIDMEWMTGQGRRELWDLAHGWHHISFVQNGVNGAKLWLDGVLRQSQTVVGDTNEWFAALDYSTGTVNKIEVGKRVGYTGSAVFDGSIDSVRIGTNTSAAGVTNRFLESASNFWYEAYATNWVDPNSDYLASSYLCGETGVAYSAYHGGNITGILDQVGSAPLKLNGNPTFPIIGTNINGDVMRAAECDGNGDWFGPADFEHDALTNHGDFTLAVWYNVYSPWNVNGQDVMVEIHNGVDDDVRMTMERQGGDYAGVKLLTHPGSCRVSGNVTPGAATNIWFSFIVSMTDGTNGTAFMNGDEWVDSAGSPSNLAELAYIQLGRANRSAVQPAYDAFGQMYLVDIYTNKAFTAAEASAWHRFTAPKIGAYGTYPVGNVREY